MRIPNLSELPDVGQACEWSRRLDSPPSTFTRAYKAGKLRGSKVGKRTLLFTKHDVLSWLGFEIIAEPAPVAPAQTIERIVTRPSAILPVRSGRKKAA